MPHEDERTFRLRPERERSRNGDKGCRSRTIVVCSVEDAIRRSVGENSLRVADVVVMRTEGHIRVLEFWIAALNDADYIARVLRVNGLIVGVEIECQRDAFQGKNRQILLLLAHCLEIGILEICAA